MAEWFSEHYSAVANSPTVGVATAAANPPIKAAPSISHAKIYKKFTSMDFTVSVFATVEIVRLFPFKSGDRLESIYLTTSGFTAGTLTADLGLHAVDDNHSGAALDIDLFGSNFSIDNVARTDRLHESGTIPTVDKGMPLWEMLALGAGTDTEDPFTDYDLTLVFQTLATLTGRGRIQCEAYYTSAGAS